MNNFSLKFRRIVADDIGTQVEEDNCFSISSRGDLNNIRNPTFVNKKTIQRRFQCFINASETRVYAGRRRPFCVLWITSIDPLMSE